MKNMVNDETRNHTQHLSPERDTKEGWFKLACELASKGNLTDAERAMKITLDIETNFPKAWVILAAILLALGRETDAEKAGKMGLNQKPKLKMTWPKLRSLILSDGIKKGTGLKILKRVVIEKDSSSKWAEMLSLLDSQKLDEAKTSDMQSDRIESSVAVSTEEKESESPMESVKQRQALPSFSTKKVEGLTKFTIEKLSPEPVIKSEIQRESEPKQKSHTLQSFSSKEVVDTIEITEQSSEHMETDTAPSLPESPEKLSSIGEAYLRRGNFVEAEKVFIKLLAIEPENSQAWTHVGSLLMKKKNYHDAENALRAATRHSYKNSEAWYLLGVSMQNQDKWKESIAPLTTACNLKQDNIDFVFKLGESQFRIGQYQDAARSFLKTLRSAPEHREAMFYLAMCMERRGNRQHALSLLIKLMNLGNLSSDMLEKMSGAFDRLNRPEEAREARRRAAITRKTTN